MDKRGISEVRESVGACILPPYRCVLSERESAGARIARPHLPPLSFS